VIPGWKDERYRKSRPIRGGKRIVVLVTSIKTSFLFPPFP